jgi:hypothetical protein
MLARRLLIALAILLGLTALAGGLAAPPRVVTPSAPGAPPGGPAVASQPVERTLDASGTGQVVRARVGQSVVIQVRSDRLDTVSLGDYGDESVDPQAPARFELLADTPGRYPIELELAQRRIGTLDVRP